MNTVGLHDALRPHPDGPRPVQPLPGGGGGTRTPDARAPRPRVPRAARRDQRPVADRVRDIECADVPGVGDRLGGDGSRHRQLRGAGRHRGRRRQRGVRRSHGRRGVTNRCHRHRRRTRLGATRRRAAHARCPPVARHVRHGARGDLDRRPERHRGDGGEQGRCAPARRLRDLVGRRRVARRRLERRHRLQRHAEVPRRRPRARPPDGVRSGDRAAHRRPAVLVSRSQHDREVRDRRRGTGVPPHGADLDDHVVARGARGGARRRARRRSSSATRRRATR